MRIYAARHGQTVWNAENRVCGRTDIPLTEQGLEQACLLARNAKDLDLDLIIASPLLRARQTAEAVSNVCGIPIVFDERLVEQDFGALESVDRQDPRFLERKRQFACPYPGGESILQVAHRVYSLLDQIRRDHAGKNVLLVCHGGVCRIIRTYFVGMNNQEYFGYSPDNATLAAYEV